MGLTEQSYYKGRTKVVHTTKTTKVVRPFTIKVNCVHSLGDGKYDPKVPERDVSLMCHELVGMQSVLD